MVYVNERFVNLKVGHVFRVVSTTPFSVFLRNLDTGENRGPIKIKDLPKNYRKIYCRPGDDMV
jgi:hypothetical protein